ncbi:hypothetical protein [Streptomyces sp. SA15]|uniref:hypothetical protein n=1 Tax=Streptomyces sp. SA15 TaxID=934019 RepID=UPI0015C7C55D|nr:hypothetical protein [Streptomyces sp. SA15]
MHTGAGELRPGRLAYRVPKSAKITAWEFSEPGAEAGAEADRGPSTIDLGEKT